MTAYPLTVPTLNDVVRSRTDLTETDLEGLHALLGEWQILADLSFADLVLWVPGRGGSGFIAVAQVRPTTGPTSPPSRRNSSGLACWLARHPETQS